MDTKFRYIVILTFGILTSACVSVDPVQSPEVVESGKLQSCKELELTKHCNSWKRARLTLRIDDLFFDISSNDTGTKIYTERTTGDTLTDQTLKPPLVIKTGRYSRKNNEVYLAVKSQLANYGVRVVKATPMVLWGDITGYLLELDGNGYAVLSALKVN